MRVCALGRSPFRYGWRLVVIQDRPRVTEPVLGIAGGSDASEPRPGWEGLVGARLRKMALRVSGRSEGVEQRPVGLAGVEQGPDPVVGEVGEPETRPVLTRLMRLFAASVAALVTRAACQLAIWCRQRQMVRP